MKIRAIFINYFIVPGCMFLFTNSLAQSDQEIIKKTNSFLDDHKYATAFKTLQEYDPYNRRPEIVLLKEEIALNTYFTSIMHQAFSFIDIPKTENVRKYRGTIQPSITYKFKINSVLDSLLNIYPDNYNLYKGLGDYYYQIYLKYGDSWLMKEDELFSKIETDYKVAIEHKLEYFQCYYVLGYVLVSKGSYKEGIPYLLKSLELDNSSADAHYNIAYAYLYSEDLNNALKHAKAALKLYKDSSERADAARMTASIYAGLKNYKKAVDYAELSNSIEPQNYYTLKYLVDFYLKTKNEAGAKICTHEFYYLDPENPTIYNDLSDVYMDNRKIPELVAFFKTIIPKANQNKIQLGSLYFYLGRLLIDSDKDAAKEDILKSREILLQVYPKDHQVFKVIDETLKSLN